MRTSPVVAEPPSVPAQPPVDVSLLFEQYKLAVEMAAAISTSRQTTNNFYIGLVSGLAALYSLLEKVPLALTRSTWEQVLPLLVVCLCVVCG